MKPEHKSIANWIKLIGVSILLVMLMFCIGCASVSLDSKGRPTTFWGWGSYKDSTGEINSDSPLKGFLNFLGFEK